MKKNDEQSDQLEQMKKWYIREQRKKWLKKQSCKAQKKAVRLVKNIFANPKNSINRCSIGAGIIFMMIPVFFIAFFLSLFLFGSISGKTEEASVQVLLSEEYETLYQEIEAAKTEGIEVSQLNEDKNNYKDTLLVYYACYADGEMDDSQKKENIKNVFCEMNSLQMEKAEYEVKAGESLGEFKITAYCGCRKCNGKWYGQPTASGTDYIEGHTIAVDPSVIPLGTKVFFNGNVYTAEDTGSAIIGKTIDLYMEDHDRCMEWGVKYIEIFLADGDSNSLKITDEKMFYKNYTINDYKKNHTLTKQQQEMLELLSEEEIYSFILGGVDKSQAITYAKMQVGVPYSQDLEERMTTHFDCSSLIYRSYETMGIILPLTAASQAEYLERRMLAVSESELQAGDLIFYSYTTNGRYKDISHVAMYLGDNKMIEASSSKNAVVIGDFRKSNIGLYCRPQ